MTGDTAKDGQTTWPTATKRVSPPPAESQTDRPDSTDPHQPPTERQNGRADRARLLDAEVDETFLAGEAGRSGMLREAATRRHMIIAYVSQDGAPRKTVIVAHFQAVRPRIGRAGTLRARRRRRTLVITWSPAANAQRYRVFVRLSDGRTLFFTSRARKRRLVVGGVKRRTSGLVTVIGERVGGRLGPKVRIKIRAA